MALGPGPMETWFSPVKVGPVPPEWTPLRAAVLSPSSRRRLGQRTRRDWATDAECIIKLWPCPIYPNGASATMRAATVSPVRSAGCVAVWATTSMSSGTRDSRATASSAVAVAVGTRRARLVTVGVNPLCHEGRGCTPKRRQEPERHLPPPPQAAH